MPSLKHAIPAADQHIVTVQEALEPLFVKLEVETDARLIRAAVGAGWSVDDALAAIDDLRRQNKPAAHH